MAHKQHEAMAKQEVNSPLIITTGVISILLLIVSAAGTEAWFRYEEQAEVDSKWRVSENAWLADVRRPQLEHLSGKALRDDQKTRPMPIDRAIELVVTQNQSKTR